MRLLAAQHAVCGVQLVHKDDNSYLILTFTRRGVQGPNCKQRRNLDSHPPLTPRGARKHDTLKITLILTPRSVQRPPSTQRRKPNLTRTLTLRPDLVDKSEAFGGDCPAAKTSERL